MEMRRESCLISALIDCGFGAPWKKWFSEQGILHLELLACLSCILLLVCLQLVSQNA